ncbi:hypothetical protein HK101_006144, partial [Irineochytrium annulatum]
MLEMDRLYGTSFINWIRSESNIGYICSFKKDLFEHYERTSPESIPRVMTWLTSDWSIASVAEIMLKLFYGYRIASIKFTRLLAQITATWSRLRQRELVNILLIGEPAPITARFIRNLTRHHSIDAPAWPRGDVADLFKSCAIVLRWNEQFMRETVIELANLLIHGAEAQLRVLHLILQTFDSPSLSASMPVSAGATPPDTPSSVGPTSPPPTPLRAFAKRTSSDDEDDHADDHYNDDDDDGDDGDGVNALADPTRRYEELVDGMMEALTLSASRVRVRRMIELAVGLVEIIYGEAEVEEARRVGRAAARAAR